MVEEWRANPKRALWALPLTIISLIVFALLFGTQATAWFVLAMIAFWASLYFMGGMSKRTLK